MDLLGFALAVLLIELTPGPNMAWLAGLAATEGRRSGLAAVAGVAIGLLGNGALAALGLAALLQAAPWLWQTLRFSGAAMMLGLAIVTWRDAQPGGAPSGGTARRAFVSGVLINLLNPKAYLFFLVVAPQFLADTALTFRQALLLSLASTAIATVVHLGIVTAGAAAQPWLSDPVRQRPVRRAFALVMLGVALSFLLIDMR